jgi:acyl carrier protein
VTRAHWMSRRNALLVLASAAAVSTATPLSAVGATPASRQQAGADDRPVPDVVRRLISKQIGVAERRVNWDARFVEDLHCDSLKAVELIMALQEKFKIEIPDQEAEKLRRVGDLVEYLRSRAVLE